MHDCFQHSFFGLNMLSVRFHAIMWRQPFSSSFSHTLISRPSRERSCYNFRAQRLPIFVIWHKYATHVISRYSKTTIFYARANTHTNIPALPGALLYNFHGIPLPIINICSNMLPVRFRAILKWKRFSHAQSPPLISWLSRERSFNNFRARHPPIFAFWPRYATRAISRDSEMATFFEYLITHTNIRAIPGALLL